ncbi:MAG: hypothetical protein Q9165_008382 [Trypethelium subeluteriae]
MAPYDQFILFGDSITEKSGSQDKGFGFAPALQDAYIRRLLVLNQGFRSGRLVHLHEYKVIEAFFSGYNTAQALRVLPRIMPAPKEAKVRFMTIFFGANDARLPNQYASPQHISPEQYRENLEQIIQHPAVKAQSPRIILITPPPIDEYLVEIADRAKGFDEKRRTAENTRRYADIVKEVGKENNVAVLDLWTALMLEAGWSDNEPLLGSKKLPKNPKMEKMLHDGIHFNPEAYKVLYTKLMDLISETWPDQVPEKLPMSDPWRLHNEMLRVQQIQQDHNERLLRLERRQDDDARMKSVWGSASSFPSVLSGTPHQTPLHHAQSDAFSGFDDEQNMIGSLHLDAETEPRRGGATSRANSVRFDESANQGHWAQNSRASIDIIPRTGSGLGGLALTERTASYKSEGRQSSGGQSVHSATSGRANSLGLDTGLSLGQSAASYPGTPGLAPGLFILGTVPSIIRCWLDMNFKHENLLYAAVCTGSFKSFLDLRLVKRLGFMGLLKEDDVGNRVIKLPTYLPEAIAHPPSSRSSSPAPQLPTVTIEFTVVDRGTDEADPKAIQIFIGSDTLRTHHADILFSSNQITLFDDDHSKLTVPLVRPENDATFRSLYITSRDPSQVRAVQNQQPSISTTVGEPAMQPSFLASPTTASSVRDASPSEKARGSASSTTGTGSPRTEGVDVATEEGTPTPSAAHSVPVERPSLGILTAKAEEKSTEPTGSLGPTPPRSGSGTSPGIWSNWRREGSATNQMDWANAGKNPNLAYQRRDTGIKVLKPTKPASRTFSGSSTTPTPSPATSQSRFFDEAGYHTTFPRAAHKCEQLPSITASHKKRKLAPEGNLDTHGQSDAVTYSVSDDVNNQPSHTSSTAISTTPNSQRSTQSPPRYIPPHLQDEVSESASASNISRLGSTSTTGSSPTDAYANLTLGSDPPTTMGSSGMLEEQDTTQEDSSASPTTPKQVRTSVADLARPKHLRSSSPAKRSAATLEEDYGTKNEDVMDVDGSSTLQNSFKNADAAVGVGSKLGGAEDTSARYDRAVSVDMLRETQSDSQGAMLTEAEEASNSKQASTTPFTALGAALQNAIDQEAETSKESQTAAPTAPSLDEQVTRIHTLYSQLEEKEGTKGFVLSGAWYNRVVAKTSEGQMSGDYSKADMEVEIGPVDNSNLVPEFAAPYEIKDERGEKFVPLRPGLLTHHDLEIIPENAWQQIVQWHGLAPNSPVIIRYLHDTVPQGSVSHNFMFELYPPIITIRKLGSETESFAGLREPTQNAPVIVASQNERAQSFLARAKTAAHVEMKTKVQVWRQIEPTGTGTVEVSNGQAGMLTPASSRNNSPAPGPSVPAVAKMLIDPATFSNMVEGSEREMVDIQDQTMNEKYNGHAQLDTVGLGVSQTLIIEEQIGGPAGGEFVSDASRIRNKKNGVANKTKTNSALSNPRVKGTESGRTSPAPTGPVTRGRTRRSGRTRGTVGLVNLGNTCYMNSALQCVRSIEELSMYFLAEKYKEELNVNNPLGHRGEIAKTYSAFVHSIYGETASAFTPRTLKSTIGRCQPLFSGYGQQDSQEFLSFLLDAIHEDLNRIHKKPYMENPESDDKTVNDPEAVKALGKKFRENHHARNDSVVMDLFSGFYKNTMVCPECDKVSITFDPYSLLTLQLPVQSSWQHTIIFAPLQGQLVKIQVDVDKNSTIRTLKEYVAKKIPGLDPKKCVVAETYNKKFFKSFDDDKAAVESIQTNDVIVVYELDDVPTNFPPPESKRKKPYINYSYNSPSSDEEVNDDSPLADRMLVPLFHRLPSANASRYSGKSMCQWPSFVLLTREEAKDYDEILRKVLAKVATMTTRPILTEDEDGFGTVSTSNSGSEAVLTTDEDASSMGGQKVKDQSVASEDSMVDVSMADDAGTQNLSAANADAAMNGTESQKKSLPSLLQPGTFIPGHLQTLFDMKYFRSGSDLVPTGWNSLNDNKDYPTVFSRVPKRPLRRSSVQSNRSTRSNNSSATSTTSSDIDNTLPSATTSMSVPGFSHDPGSDSEDLPSDRTMLSQRRFRAGPKKRGGGGKLKTYGSNKGKRAATQYHTNSFDGAADADVDDAEDDSTTTNNNGHGSGSGMLIKPHEGLVLDWNPDAYEGLFAAATADELRGAATWETVPTLPDAGLDAARAKRAARRKHGVGLEECFAETARSEILSEENAWYCNRCKELRLASKTLEVWTVPDVLVLHLKRFSAHRGFRDKVDVLVDFPIEGLDLGGRVGLPEGKDLVYDLFAVDNHYGGLGGGHYTAFAQNFYDKKWYEYNDSVVSQCTNPQSVVTPAAYLLFYRRRSSIPLGDSFLRDLVLSLRNADSDDSPDETNNNPTALAAIGSRTSSPTTTTAGDGRRLGSAGLAGAEVETAVAHGTMIRQAEAAAVGAGLRGGWTGSAGSGGVVAAGPGRKAGSRPPPWLDEEDNDEEEDEGVKMGDDEEDGGGGEVNVHGLPAYGPATPGNYNVAAPGWDFSFLGTPGGPVGVEDDGVADVDADVEEDAASDQVAAGSALGEELGNRMLEDFGDETAHPGFGTPVQRDTDEEMLDTPGLESGIMRVRAPSEGVEDAPVAEVKLDEGDSRD